MTPAATGSEAGGDETDASDDGLTPFERAVVEVVNQTDPGDVMAYGEVAAEAGFPGAARAVGGVLRRIDGLPWWRIVAANGRLLPHDPAEHAKRLRAEGVRVRGDRVVMPGSKAGRDSRSGRAPDA